MKKILLSSLFLIAGHTVQPAPLDGTSAVVYQTTTYDFSDGDYARGCVRLAGFSVPAEQRVVLNTFVPVTGSVNANDTGILELEGDLALAAGARFSSGAVIDGKNKTIFFQGPLGLPQNAVFQLTSSVTLDGQGHRLTLRNTQFNVSGDSDITFTLRNMTLYGLKDLNDSLGAIRFEGAGSHKLVLDNVVVYLTDDGSFDGAALTVKNNVVLTGGKQLTFKASNDMVIEAGSAFIIDLRTKLNYEPADKKSTHLVFGDKNARLVLMGGTIFSPKDTGITMVSGHLVVDHKSYLQQDWADSVFGPERGAFTLGNGYEKFNMNVDVLPGAQLVFDAAKIQYNIADPATN